MALALAPAAPAPAPIRHGGDPVHSRRLLAAFDALATFPVLAESRAAVLRAVRSDQPSLGDIVAAVESDAGLVTMVLRMANGIASNRRGKVATIPAAVDLLTPQGVGQLASEANVFEFFGSAPDWEHTPERFRIHGIAVQAAAERLARELDYPRRDELLAAAPLHDIGKLLLVHAYPAYPEGTHGDARTPEERLARERRMLGVDHATAGGVLARRWGLPELLCRTIENHHRDDSAGDAAFLRVADMLAHYAHGDPVDPGALARAASSIDLSPKRLRRLLYRLPSRGAKRRSSGPSPLTRRETEMLKLLARGKSCKQIALELNRSASTVRTHLHNTYRKLSALDRSQAVLIAAERGWI